MDIDNRGMDAPVSHEFLESKQVSSILIMVGCKSVPESMAGKAVFPTERIFMGMYKIRDTLMVNRFRRIPFLWKKPVTGTFCLRKGIPVL